MTHPPRLSASACLAVAGLLAFAAAAPAADIVVNTNSDSIIDDDGRCTLREAIASANADAPLHGCTTGDGADTILLTSSEIVMSVAGSGEDGNLTGDFDVTDDLTIRPASPDDITFIDADGLDRLFKVQDGADLTLERLQLRGGDVVGFGGAIVTFEPDSVLTLLSTVVADNTSTLFGGGIAAAGPTELRESLVFDNTSAFGGGVYLFNNNKLVLLRSEVSDNTASSDGGGVFGAGVILVESTVSDNTAGRDGAGLFIQEDDGPVGSTIINSTVAFNEAERHGGGLYLDFSGTLELFNVTVGFNVADRDGDNAGDGGGLFVDAGTVRPRHSIFGGNLDGSPGGVSAPDCSGPVESAGRNLFSSIDFAVCQTSGAFASDFVGSLGSPLDPGLEPCLENVGEGVFSTLALLDDSPAVDAGDPAGCLSVGGSTLEGDQLGNRRIWDGPDPDDIARCDLGAVELGAPSLTLIFRDGFESADLSAWSAVIQPSPARAPAPAWAPSTRAPAPSTLAERLRALVGPSRGGCPK